MKNLINLKGAFPLSKAQKQTINGGGDPPQCVYPTCLACETITDHVACVNDIH